VLFRRPESRDGKLSIQHEPTPPINQPPHPFFSRSFEVNGYGAGYELTSNVGSSPIHLNQQKLGSEPERRVCEIKPTGLDLYSLCVMHSKLNLPISFVLHESLYQLLFIALRSSTSLGDFYWV
jgi:hypothetical protein